MNQKIPLLLDHLSNSLTIKFRKSKIGQFTYRHTGKILLVSIVCILLFPIAKQCRIQNRFGVIIGSPELGGIFFNRFEVIMVISVDSGKAFYNAGFRPGDVLLDTAGHSMMEGYIQSFDQPAGTEIRIKTIPNGGSASNSEELHKMKQVTRKVVAP